MDFGTLLSVAQKNETNQKQRKACYQTKFAPPKKVTKQTKTLSDNIKKFLARKEQEDRQKALDEKKKKENLLALRDHKAQSRINKHLKVCKAANKSVLADAIDNENTAVTIAGPSQCDEDDYGYVSQEASAFYNQLMNKYNAAPQKPLFSSSGKKSVKDIASTKDRVKMALKQQEEEEALGHRRKRKSANPDDTKSDEKESAEKIVEYDKEKDRKDEKPKPKKKPMPPPMDFGQLLKIAEKKQYEPVVIEAKPKVEEPERLMTKRQMKEYAKEKDWREKREQRDKVRNTESSSKSTCALSASGKPAKPAPIGKIPKLSGVSSAEKSEKSDKSNNTINSSSTWCKPSSAKADVSSPTKKPTTAEKSSSRSAPSKQTSSKAAERDSILEERKKLEAERKKLEEMRQAIEEEAKKLAKSKSKQEKPAPKPKPVEKPVSSAKDAKSKPNVASGPSQKPRVPPVSNGKAKQFPPPDLKPLKPKPPMGSRPMGGGNARRPPPIGHKRRIYDDDEEYDSELDDFIDDGPEDDSADYSKYISEIFGYDKNKYRYNEEDDTAMESSFAQQLKEEYVSTKIGIMEDLEDIRMEALEKKRKALIRKKLKK